MFRCLKVFFWYLVEIGLICEEDIWVFVIRIKVYILQYGLIIVMIYSVWFGGWKSLSGICDGSVDESWFLRGDYVNFYFVDIF